MKTELKNKLFDCPQLRDQTGIFEDRTDAGGILADLLQQYCVCAQSVWAIPAGGLPVADVVARRLTLPLEVAVVSKITPDWNSEVGYGAVAFDGTVLLNESYITHFNLSPDDIQAGIADTREKVYRRCCLFRGARPLPEMKKQTFILIDDGLASGFTMRTAVKALHTAGARAVIIAIPTAHTRTALALSEEAEGVYCPNLRGGPSFAVADAYRCWSDISESQAVKIYQAHAK